MAEMVNIDLRELKDSFVIHYGGELTQVNAYTFGNSLLSICSILEEINKEINPGFGVEIHVEAIGPGSFRPVIKTTAKSLKNLFSDIPKKFIVTVLCSILFKYILPSEKSEIIFQDEVVIIESDGLRVTIPKEAYNSQQIVIKNPKVQSKIRETFEILDNDEAIINFGVAKDIKDKDLLFDAPRKEFGRIAQLPEIIDGENENSRVKREKVELVIIKALLEKSRRRWQFLWRGIKISASIKDHNFLDKVVSRDISFTYGDRLNVWLLIFQERDEALDEFMNIEYQVEEVLNHIPAKKQEPLI